MEILTLKKEQKNLLLFFQFIHNRILNKTHKNCKYIMPFKKGILEI